jgi:hypothetical protein
VENIALQSDEQGLEVGHNVADQVRHTMERFDQRLALGNLRLAERYGKEELHILVFFSIGRSDVEYVACFKRNESIRGSDKDIRNDNVRRIASDVRPELLHRSLHRGANIEGSITRNGRNQQAVFINIVKFAETPEHIVSTLVWFERVDSFNRIWPHTLYFSSSVGFVFRGTGGIGNRETDASDLLVSQGSAVDIDEARYVGKLPSEMIESASQVLERVADDNRDSDWDVAHADKIIDQLSCLRIALGADYICVGHKERANFSLKVTEVLFGPFNFYADQANPFIGGHGMNKKQEAKQKTPKGHEIPIPKRGDVFKVFKNAAKPEKELGTRSPKKKGLK